MLYLAFICSSITVFLVGAHAFKDFKEEPEKRLGIVVALIVFTTPFIYIANEVLNRVF
jgi:hypothetical protein